MGTSTARRAPSTPAWRWAKGAATRYLSPVGAPAVEAQEVVRRYVAALQETGLAKGHDLLGEFRLIRKAAQCLGEFGDTLRASGLATALEPWGLADLAHRPPAEAILGLSAVWVEEQGGLESHVARSALAACLAQIFAAEPALKSPLGGPALVRFFLASSICQRLALDLGEALEAAAPEWREYNNGLARVEELLLSSNAKAPEDPPWPGQWQGLTGWLWVTQVLENFLERYRDAKPVK